MPVCHYPNLVDADTLDGEEQLVALLEANQRRAGGIGQVSMQTTSGDQTMYSIQGADTLRIERMRILYALFLRNPEKWANPYAQRVKRRSPDYT